MKKNIFLFAFFAVTISNAQNLKTYSGSFKGGEATYTYYEDDDSRVFEGKFHWKGKSSYGHQSGGRIEITGNFKNNKRVGLWVFTATNEKNQVNELKVNYVEGVREGICEYEGNWYVLFDDKMKYTTTNKNGIVDGPVIIEFPDFVITGEYTQGHRIGLWEKKFKEGSYYHIVCNGSELEDEYSKEYTEVRNGNFFYDIEDGSKRGASESEMLCSIDCEIYYKKCREFEELVQIREDNGIVRPKNKRIPTQKENSSVSQQKVPNTSAPALTREEAILRYRQNNAKTESEKLRENLERLGFRRKK